MKQKTNLRLAKGVVLLSVVPLLIYAYEYGPDAGVAGVPGENGTCSQSGCHTGTAVNGGGGSVTVTFPNGLTYTPGAKQHLVVTIDDSRARRWGFELTARLASDTKQLAGTFSPTDKRTQLICASPDLVKQLNFDTACPASLPVQYIEQTLAGYTFTQPNPGKFEFDWNVPASDVGPVTIYVAANAANGDLSQNGDHIYTANYTLTAGGAASPLPAITSGGVVNAASQAIPGLPNAAIAQGSIFVINGANFGAGASVQVVVNGTTLAATIVAASSTQVTAIMPSTIPAGSGTVTVTVDNQTSAAEPVQVTSANFGIFTLNGMGSGPAMAADSSGTAITLTNAAQPGQTVTLSGTGLGAINGDEDIGSQVTAYVGTEQAAVQHARRSGTAPGQDQVTFTIPDDAIAGCYVPVSVVVNKITSNFASIAIAPAGSACSDGNGLTAAQVQAIQASNGNLRVASVNLTRVASSSGGTPADTGSAVFGTYTSAQLASWLGPLQAASAGGCLVSTGNDPTQPQALDAGAISITGPNGTQTLTGTAGVYTAQFPAYLDPGSYALASDAFQAQVNVPPPIVWTNASSISSVDRTQGVTVTWAGGDPNGFVYISGKSAGAMFTCTAPASAGTFTVPPMVSQALPSSSPGTLTLTGVTAVAFSASGIDIGVATGGSGVTQAVAFR